MARITDPTTMQKLSEHSTRITKAEMADAKIEWLKETIEHRFDDMDKRIDQLLFVINENDRRYSELEVEKDKALKIKENADRIALDLARDIQKYKDEKANELREQISSERGLYATKDDVASLGEKIEAKITPLINYINSQQGRSGGLSAGWGYLLGAVSLVATLLAIVGWFAR